MLFSLNYQPSPVQIFASWFAFFILLFILISLSRETWMNKVKISRFTNKKGGKRKVDPKAYGPRRRKGRRLINRRNIAKYGLRSTDIKSKFEKFINQ